jgi:hypothetical protein
MQIEEIEEQSQATGKVPDMSFFAAQDSFICPLGWFNAT